MRFNSINIRKKILGMAYSGSTVHIGCSFSIVEIVAVLFRSFLRFPDNDPNSMSRDFMILSKGHGVMALYSCLNELGWLSDCELKNYFKDGSELKGLSDSRVKGLEVTSGSLGHGFSVGVGMAFGASKKNSDQKTYVIVGDGELNEGPIWEGALFAGHHKLKNLMILVDNNGFQAMGPTSDILALDSLKEKFKAFNFETVEVDGHDEVLLESTIKSLWNSKSSQPKAIIANTIKGRGVTFMEGNNEWHYTRLDSTTYALALKELI
jgi:transketolase